MSLRMLLLFPVSLVLCSACSHPSSEEAPGAAASVKFLKNYEPPHFADQDRLQNTAEALSEAHHFYKESALENHIPGVAYGVVVDDSLVFFGGYGITSLETEGTVTEQSLFRIASMSKSFTAMAVLRLRDEGKLSLSDPAFIYLPELEQLTYLTSDAAPVTIYNLLTMTAGFPEDNPWGDRFLDISDKALMEQVSEGISFSNVPSFQYEYSNLGFGLLGQIITRVSGLPFQEYITRNILHPLGMNNTCYEYSEVPADLLALGYRWEDSTWVSEPLLHDGAFGSMGGLITSIEDFSKYVSFHLSAWPPRSDPDSGPVKRSTLREMHRLNNPRYLTDTKWFGNDTRPLIQGYGFGLRGIQGPDGVLEIGHGGGLPGFGSNYMFFPQMGIGIMAFGNLTYVGGPLKSANYKVILELIDQELFSPRILPASEILKLRKEQVAQLIQHWDPRLEEQIVAANLYMDISRERRMKEAVELLLRAGKIIAIGPVIPENQLRGRFILKGEQRNISVYFTLSPEAVPRVQFLSLELMPDN
jgi:CubicO group peptidase (beta-lactamase class C family)